jgi:demethylmenaquinone methyltransferase/2-methoxy-6-polyprenyl-1,4-benzoquinol methylase
VRRIAPGGALAAVALGAAVAETLRVVRPGGRIVVPEFCRPRERVWPAIFGFYLQRVLPIVGCAVSGHPGAYAYLAASVARFGSPEALARRFAAAGARRATVARPAGDVAALVIVRK